VPQIAAGAQEQPLVAPEQIIQKNGYIYIYVSNESAQKVFFDNLVIHHNKGHLLEEDQYYPFGLEMAGISDKALPNIPNNYLYNGKELQQNEFNDGTSLEDYDYGFRGYDPQIARFTEQDPLTDEFATVSPYQYALNDPVANIDKDGLASVPLGEVTITAKAIHRMSAFSSFTSKLLGEAGLASEAINLSSLGVHVLQTGGVLGLTWLTRSIGMRAASNIGIGSNYLLENTDQTGHPKKNLKTNNNEGNSDFDNWFSNELTSIGMFSYWLVGHPFLSNHWTFVNDKTAYAFKNAWRVNQARKYFYKKYKGEKNLKGASVLDFKGSFGVLGYIKAGFDPIEQFVGSYRVDINVINSNTLKFTITNNTSFKSLTYGVGPSWKSGPMSNFYQTYIFTEPIDFNKLK
jgi:RHS repeat-associated protein